MRTKNYHEAQNDRWHEQYLNSEKLLSEMEDTLHHLEALALRYITDEEGRKAVKHLVDAVDRPTRHSSFQQDLSPGRRGAGFEGRTDGRVHT